MKRLCRCTLFDMALLCVILTCSFGRMYAQDDGAITLNDDFSFPSGVKIPHDSKVLLAGRIDSTITKVTVQWFVGVNEGTVEGDIGDSMWTAIVGPFPPRKKVIFRISTVSVFPQDRVEAQTRSILDDLVERIDRSTTPMSKLELARFIEINLRQATPSNLKKYTIPTGGTFYDTLIHAILDEGITGVMQTYMDNENIRQLKKDIKDKKEDIQKNSNDKSKAEDVKNDLLQIQSDEAKIQELLGELQGQLATITSKVALDIQKIASFDSETPTEAMVGGLQNNAGFDIGALATTSNAVVPFFLISPYFHEVDIDDSPRKFFDFVSLTGGIGISTSDIDAKGAIYYLGVGCRINRIFRLTIGTDCFVANDTGKLIWKLGAGGSINVNYLGDLLGLFNTASKTTSDQNK